MEGFRVRLFFFLLPADIGIYFDRIRHVVRFNTAGTGGARTGVPMDYMLVIFPRGSGQTA